jgi:hypothetical protein
MKKAYMENTCSPNGNIKNEMSRYNTPVEFKKLPSYDV